jgi:hypothetical protein
MPVAATPSDAPAAQFSKMRALSVDLVSVPSAAMVKEETVKAPLVGFTAKERTISAAVAA